MLPFYGGIFIFFSAIIEMRGDPMKNNLRKTLLSQRDALSKEAIYIKSYAVYQALQSTKSYQESKNIFCFISFGSEIKTELILADALLNKDLYVPCIDKQTKKMVPVKMTTGTQLYKNNFGIYEPTYDPHADIPDHFDLAIVPGLAFDRRGHRIGYGKGHYDNFFSKYPVTHKAGIAFAFQIIVDLPNQDYDQTVDTIITEEEIISIPRLPK